MRLVGCLIAIVSMAGGLRAQEKPLEIGQRAPEISLPTPDGDTVSLSSLKGKLVLIDFWATWCAPCVKEQPELKALYDIHKGEGKFEIFGVSLDKSRDNWVKAIERFDIDWIQVSDLLFWRSPVAKEYAIEELPFNMLVDKRGNIAAINLHGEELERLIETRLNDAHD